jgi:hypothetical protein
MEARLHPRAHCMPIVRHTHNSRIFGYHAQEKMAQPRRTMSGRKEIMEKLQLEFIFSRFLLSICLTAR